MKLRWGTSNVRGGEGARCIVEDAAHTMMKAMRFAKTAETDSGEKPFGIPRLPKRTTTAATGCSFLLSQESFY